MTAIQKALKFLDDEAAFYGMASGSLDGVPFEHVAHVVKVMRARLAALDAETEVRELGWFKPDSRNTLSRAETPFGVYRVWTHHEANGRWFWSLDGYEKRSGDVASEADGFSAAQADYELTIRSALVPPETEDWLTMDSAPKDDTAILAWGNDAEEEACYRAIVCRIDGERGWWVRGGMPFYPKFWHALPSPPESRS